MKITRALTLTLVAVFAVSAAACAGDKKKNKKQTNQATGGSETQKGPTPMTDAEKKIQAQAMDLMDKVAAAAVTHKDDCDALADAWLELWNENQSLIKQAIKIDSDPQKVAEWEAAHGERKKAIDEKLKPAFENCGRHKRIVELLAKMKPKAKPAADKKAE